MFETSYPLVLTFNTTIPTFPDFPDSPQDYTCFSLRKEVPYIRSTSYPEADLYYISSLIRHKQVADVEHNPFCNAIKDLVTRLQILQNISNTPLPLS